VIEVITFAIKGDHIDEKVMKLAAFGQGGPSL